MAKLKTQPMGGFAVTYLFARRYVSHFFKRFFWHNPLVTFWNKKLLITLLFIPVPLIHN